MAGDKASNSRKQHSRKTSKDSKVNSRAAPGGAGMPLQFNQSQAPLKNGGKTSTSSNFGFPYMPVAPDCSIEDQVNELIKALQPCHKSDERRSTIFHHVRAILQERYESLECYLMGSYPLRTYLPDSDLDLTVSPPPSYSKDKKGNNVMQDDEWLVVVNEALCRAAISGGLKTQTRSMEPMEIRNVSFVNARTKVVTCVVQNVSVDITINQMGSLATLTFLEEVDAIIGCNHLFKRSVLLVKAWCLHESPKYVGFAVLGSKSNAGLCSYALSIMILSLFNEQSVNKLQSPFQVFIKFLEVYSVFDWNRSVLTVGGSIALSKWPKKGGADGLHSKSRFGLLIQKLRKCYKDIAATNATVKITPEFLVRPCNIEDPLNPTNNLGYSLNRQSLQFLQHALAEARRHLEYLLSCSLVEAPGLLQGLRRNRSISNDSGLADVAGNRNILDSYNYTWDKNSASEFSVSSGGSDDGSQSDSSENSLPTSGSSTGKASPPPPQTQPSFASRVGRPSDNFAPHPHGVPYNLSPPNQMYAPNFLRPGMALLSFFPRLYQMYANESVRRADLLNHPCESRTSMLICDPSPPTSPVVATDLLSGEINLFWSNLSKVSKPKDERPATEVAETTDRSPSMPTPKTRSPSPEKIARTPSPKKVSTKCSNAATAKASEGKGNKSGKEGEVGGSSIVDVSSPSNSPSEKGMDREDGQEEEQKGTPHIGAREVESGGLVEVVGSSEKSVSESVTLPESVTASVNDPLDDPNEAQKQSTAAQDGQPLSQLAHICTKERSRKELKAERKRNRKLQDAAAKALKLQQQHQLQQQELLLQQQQQALLGSEDRIGSMTVEEISDNRCCKENTCCHPGVAPTAASMETLSMDGDAQKKKGSYLWLGLCILFIVNVAIIPFLYKQPPDYFPLHQHYRSLETNSSGSETAPSSSHLKSSAEETVLPQFVLEGSRFSIGESVPTSDRSTQSYHYQWMKNGFSIPHANAPFYSVEEADRSAEGLYLCYRWQGPLRKEMCGQTLIKVSSAAAVKNRLKHQRGTPLLHYQGRLNGGPAGPISGSHAAQATNSTYGGTYDCEMWRAASGAVY